MSPVDEPRTVEHPGPLLPGGPRFTVDLPDGWTAEPAPRALAVLRPVAAPSTGVANLTVTADLVPVGTTAAAVLEAMLAQYPGQVARPEGGEDPGRARADLTRHHEGSPVEQRVDVQLDLPELPGGLRHALTVVSTWSTTTSTDLREALAHAHTTVRLGTVEPVQA
ncbi:hypothetical protein J4G33_03150 [Actinotalea sp. BY-33]|uniref:Uncharacterized protein n=1 Tax=Actinotalea soli TaxID=2819234 RepID=A0A939LNM0_9CELL|nr:hypothetical protein [Actinotalea soli]MBO1750793.1 hypothetical protein [Actinotalea soli]